MNLSTNQKFIGVIIIVVAVIILAFPDSFSGSVFSGSSPKYDVNYPTQSYYSFSSRCNDLDKQWMVIMNVPEDVELQQYTGTLSGSYQTIVEPHTTSTFRIVNIHGPWIDKQYIANYDDGSPIYCVGKCYAIGSIYVNTEGTCSVSIYPVWKSNLVTTTSSTTSSLTTTSVLTTSTSSVITTSIDTTSVLSTTTTIFSRCEDQIRGCGGVCPPCEDALLIPIIVGIAIIGVGIIYFKKK